MFIISIPKFESCDRSPSAGFYSSDSLREVNEPQLNQLSAAERLQIVALVALQAKP